MLLETIGEEYSQITHEFAGLCELLNSKRAQKMIPLAKLTRPMLRATYPRLRLLDRLTEATRTGSVWISGPAGSGKTTLVADWSERRGGPMLWFKIDTADGELATLFHYLGIAASRLSRRKVELPAFSAENQGGMAAFSRRFFRELWAALPAGLALVLDDCQEADGSRDFRGALRSACDECPEGRSLILVSRVEPSPELARLVTLGSLTVIDPAELRLTPEETKGVVRLRGARLAPQALAELQQRVDGWIAGLILLLSAGAQVPPAESEAAAPMLFDYLAGEVLDRLDPVTRRVLVETALLGNLTPPTAIELTEIPTAGQVLSRLARRGWFVNRHEGREPVFSFHPLFRDLLLARGREEIPAERLSTLRRTSARFQAERGDVEGAVEALGQTGAVAEQVELVLRCAQQTIAEGRFETLRRWILELPVEVRQREPWLEYWLGVSWSGFDPGELRRNLELAYQGFWRRGDPAGCVHACAAVVDSFLIEWGDLRPLDHWGTALEELRRRWIELPDPVLAGFLACAAFTVFLSRRPGDPETQSWEERTAALATHSTVPMLCRKSAFAIAHLSLWRGDMPLARRMFEFLQSDRAHWRESSPNLGWHACRARYLVFSGQSGDGYAEAVAGLELAEATGAHFLDVGLLGVAVMAAIAWEDLDLAESRLADLERDFGARERLNLWYVRFPGGAVALRRGRLAQAVELLQESETAAQSAGSPLLALWSKVGLAATDLARGESESFQRRIDHLEEEGRRSRAHIVVWWCRLLRAAQMVRKDERRAALIFLEALEGSRTHGPFVPLWLEGAELSRLCAAAWAHGSQPELVRNFVQTYRLAPPDRLEGVDSWPFPIVIRVLGPFKVERNGVEVEFGRKRPKRLLDLLKALITQGGTDVPAWRLTELLWPDAEGDAARHTLEMALHRLRKLAGDIPIVEQRGMRLSINRRMCGVDAFILEPLLVEMPRVTDGREDLEVARDRLRKILALYRGPYLASDEEGWAERPRERLRRLLRARLDTVSRALQRAGQGDQSAELWKTAEERDGTLEVAPLRLVAPCPGTRSSAP